MAQSHFAGNAVESGSSSHQFTPSQFRSVRPEHDSMSFLLTVERCPDVPALAFAAEIRPDRSRFATMKCTGRA